MIRSNLLSSMLPAAGTALVATLVSFTPAANAFTLNSVSGNWTGTVGGTGIVYQTVGDENQVRWGSAATSSGKSGLGFTGVGLTDLSTGSVFQLGRLRHFNNPIWSGTAASAASITLELDFQELGLQEFDFTFDIDETPNVAGTCAYFSTAPCADKIAWSNSISSSNAFTFDDKDYTLELVGFSDSPEGDVVNEFISQEGGTSEAYLFAKIAQVESEETTDVPEPAMVSALSLVGASLLLARRKRGQ